MNDLQKQNKLYYKDYLILSIHQGFKHVRMQILLALCLTSFSLAQEPLPPNSIPHYEVIKSFDEVVYSSFSKMREYFRKLEKIRIPVVKPKGLWFVFQSEVTGEPFFSAFVYSSNKNNKLIERVEYIIEGQRVATVQLETKCPIPTGPLTPEQNRTHIEDMIMARYPKAEECQYYRIYSSEFQFDFIYRKTSNKSYSQYAITSNGSDIIGGFMSTELWKQDRTISVIYEIPQTNGSTILQVSNIQRAPGVYEQEFMVNSEASQISPFVAISKYSNAVGDFTILMGDVFLANASGRRFPQ